MSAPQTMLVPSFTRKKNVDVKFNPNTYRVLIGDAEHWGVRDPLPVLAVPDHLSKRYSIPETNNAPRLVPDLRHNNPQPWHCSFLRNNVRTLNDPVCHVATYNVKEQQPEWWRTDIPASKSAAPPHTEDSTFRADFKRWDHNRRATRHSSNPNTLAAAGIVPVTSIHERNGMVPTWQEDISYEHMYDARKKNNYPPRAKRHGAFCYREVGQRPLKDFLENENASKRGSTSAPTPSWRPTGLMPLQRQFNRRNRAGEDTVASLMQPEFDLPWTQPDPKPLFSG